MSKELLTPIGHETDIRVKSEWEHSNLTPLKNALTPDLSVTYDDLLLFDRVMYAVGNSETKQITLTHGLTRSGAMPSEICRKMERDLKTSIGVPENNVIGRHIKKSFIPTGLVKKNGTEYKLTEEGSKIAKPTAAVLLDYSSKNDFLASSVFGKPATTSDNRSYISRSAVLLFLSKNESYEIEICRELDMDLSVVRTSIKNLVKNGLIEHVFGGTERQGENTFVRKGDENLIQHNVVGNAIRRNIIEYFRVNTEGNTFSIAKALEKKDQSEISKMLSELADCGFIERAAWYNGVKQSQTKITDKGMCFVEDVIKPVLRICTQDEHEVQRAQQIIINNRNNPNEISRTIIKYQEQIMEIPDSIKSQRLIEFIKENGPTRTKEIGKKLGMRTTAILTEMVEDGLLIRYTSGKNSFYLTPETESPLIRKECYVPNFEKPENLIANPKPKEYYFEQLEKVEFWRELADDIEKLGNISCTENEFLRYFDPKNLNWVEKDKSTGKYSRLIVAFKRSGVANPGSFIRNYTPKCDNIELKIVMIEAQNLIKDRLITMKGNWQYYIEEMNTPIFWSNLEKDLDVIKEDMSFSAFMTRYKRDPGNTIYPKPRGDYYRIYNAICKHSESPNLYLLDFKPDLSDDVELKELIQLVQEKIRVKLKFYRKPMFMDDWIRSFNSSHFWQEFGNDLNSYSSKNGSFWNYLYRYDETNIDLKDKKCGKYYSLVKSISKNTQYFCEQNDLEKLPNKIKSGVAVAIRLSFYFKAPIEIRDKLIALFPKDFSFAFEPLDMSDNMSYFMTLPDITDQEQVLLADLFSQVKEKIDYGDELANMERNMKGASAAIWSGIKSYPVLSDKEHRSLVISCEHARRAKKILDICDGDHPHKYKLQQIINKGEFSMECLVKSNQRLVLYFANKYNNGDTNVTDLYQVGNIGLLNAIDSFDWKRGIKFSTFAGENIKGYMLKSRSSMKGMSTRYYNQLQMVTKSMAKLEEKIGRKATFAEIAKDTDIPVDRVEALLKRANTKSLEEKLSNSDGEQRDLGSVTPDRSVSIENQVVKKILKEKVAELIYSGIISERQATIIQMRYGINTDKCYTLREIGGILSLTHERVRQLEAQALEKLRNNKQMKSIKDSFFD